MILEQQEFEHPRQVSRVRLKLYGYQPPQEQSVAGMMPEAAGLMLTEERVGSTQVVKTLGFFGDEAEARAAWAGRARELTAQGYSPASSTLQPSIPPGPLGASEPNDARSVRAHGRELPRVVVPGDPTPRPPKPA